MNKKTTLWALGLVVSFAVLALWAADTVKVNRVTTGISAQGGTTVGTTGWHTFVVANSPTNEFMVESVNVSISAGNSVGTNTFSSAYITTPTIVMGQLWGGVAITTTYIGASKTMVSATIATTTATSITLIPVLVYGYKRTGVFSQ